MKGQPKGYRGGIPDAVVEGVWNPATVQNDLTVTISGERLEWLHRRGLLLPADAANIKATLQQPDSVFQTIDDDHLFYKAVGPGPTRLYYVRVRSTGNRAFAWGVEQADPTNIRMPFSRGGDRMKRRVR